MNVLITGAWKEAKNHIKKIEEMGHHVYFLQYEKDKFPCKYSDIEAVICNGLFLHHSIENFTNLKYIQLTSAGYDRIPMEYIEKKKIQIFNVKGVYSIPMAEFAIMGILSLYKDLYGFYQNKSKKLWKRNYNLKELTHQKVAILGMGYLGIEIAKKLKGFECDVIGFDITEIESDFFDETHHIEEYTIYAYDMDIIIVCLPLANNTINFINESNLTKLKQTSILVNLSRGKVINQNDLIKSLDSNKIMGAVLDVFDEEPLDSDSKLWSLNNVILTPHNSFVSNNNNTRLSSLILDNLKFFIE